MGKYVSGVSLGFCYFVVSTLPPWAWNHFATSAAFIPWSSSIRGEGTLLLLIWSTSSLRSSTWSTSSAPVSTNARCGTAYGGRTRVEWRSWHPLYVWWRHCRECPLIYERKLQWHCNSAENFSCVQAQSWNNNNNNRRPDQYSFTHTSISVLSTFAGK